MRNHEAGRVRSIYGDVNSPRIDVSTVGGDITAGQLPPVLLGNRNSSMGNINNPTPIRHALYFSGMSLSTSQMETMQNAVGALMNFLMDSV